MTREAPALHFAQQEKSTPPYRIGDEVTLWIHDYRGEIIQAPTLSRKDIGISQLVVSTLSLVLAIVLWKVRNVLPDINEPAKSIRWCLSKKEISEGAGVKQG